MENKTDKTFLALIVSIFCLIILSLVFLKPQVAGDGVTYLDSINFLVSGEATADFMPNRLMTTLAGLEIIIIFGKLFGSQLGVWLTMNMLFYAFTAIIFYELLKLLFTDKKVALLGTLFLMGNYATLAFGLNYLMDMGGWFFYVASLWLVLRYVKFNRRSELLLAAFLVGIGGLFKEYALLGVIPIAGILIYENYNSFSRLIKQSYLPAILASGPILLVYVIIYLKFNYTYLDWVNDSYKYGYSSSLLLRLTEYIKSFGSLYNLLAIFLASGFVVLCSKWRHVLVRERVFIVSVIASFLPVFIWGGVTQRILFITVPAAIIISCFFFERHKNKLYLYYVILSIYISLSFLMDSVILNKINLPF